MSRGRTGERSGVRVPVVVLVALVPLLAPPAALAPATGASTGHAAWLPSWVMAEAVAEMRTHADLFGTASPFWYDVRSCRDVTDRQGAGDPLVVARLREQGLRVQPTVSATGLSPAAAVRCLGDEGRRRDHVARLVGLAATGGYDGLDVDYEHLALTTRPATARRVRAAFTAFVGELCPALRAAGKACSVTVMPRTSGRFTVWRGKLMPAVYAYKPLAARADEIRVMAYDQHALAHGPGPIAGLPWVRRIVRYAVATMPSAKVRLGVPTYGRDFSDGSSVSLTRDAATELAERRGVTPRWSSKQAEATFTYRRAGVRHTVWFSSPRAVARRTRLAQRRGLAGVVYWAAGLAHSGTWTAVRRG
jgi:spore germination protein